MDSIIDKNNCSCPLECNYLSYSFSMVSTPFNAEKMCPSKLAADDYLMKQFYLHKNPPQFIRNLLNRKEKTYLSKEGERCMKNIQYRAEVTFRLATENIPVIVMSRRLTFFDKLSAFGNK